MQVVTFGIGELSSVAVAKGFTVVAVATLQEKQVTDHCVWSPAVLWLAPFMCDSIAFMPTEATLIFLQNAQ